MQSLSHLCLGSAVVLFPWQLPQMDKVAKRGSYDSTTLQQQHQRTQAAAAAAMNGPLGSSAASALAGAALAGTGAAGLGAGSQMAEQVRLGRDTGHNHHRRMYPVCIESKCLVVVRGGLFWLWDEQEIGWAVRWLVCVFVVSPPIAVCLSGGGPGCGCTFGCGR